jgi:hypothetical protein
MKNRSLIAGAILAWSAAVLAQPHGDVLYRAKNDHSGNLLRVTWYNYGMLGSRKNDLSTVYAGEWPINSGHVQCGNASSFIGSEIPVYDPAASAAAGDTVFTNVTPVIFCEGWDPDNFSHDSLGTFLGFEPLPGYHNMDNPSDKKAAMSHEPVTWPAYWPDKLEDAVNPGWRGAWDGYFGYNVFQADQEGFTVMDDYHYSKRINNLNLPRPLAGQPDRGGLGIRESIRGLQWSNPDAEDAIFWIYEISNIGELSLHRTVFGMNVGASMGGLVSGNPDYMDDCATYYREIGLTTNYDWDNVGSQGYQPVPWMGFAFLESPGNPYDGIDNDGDAANAPGGGHLITTADFAPRFVQAGDPVVSIDYASGTYERRVVPMPADGIRFRFQNADYAFLPGAYLTEIPRNGVDDNLNGLIDESDGAEITATGEIFYLYIRNDVYNKKDYLARDFRTGEGLSNKMIDERRDDGVDNDGDWDAMNDDVGLDGAEGTGDEGEGDGLPTPGRGELPGEQHIDRVDVDESDQIGLTSFIFYEYGSLVYSNDDQIWQSSRPGFFDSHLENVDADYIYASGYFPLLPGQKEGFSVAQVYGEDEQDILRNKDVVQQIYNSNYNFAVAPRLPTLRAVPGDGKVTLYWDEAAELSKDRYLNAYDFEGYKIYRATDPGFVDAGVVTDGFGYAKYKKPLAVYDKIDGVSGFFPKTFGTGVQFYLGAETGLVHAYVDSPLVNGRRYFYAVTAFDKGDEANNISPSETNKYVTVAASGAVQTGQNVQVVTPRAAALGYVPAEFSEAPHYASGGEYIGTGVLRGRIVDPSRTADGKVTRIEFIDTASDSVDNDGDWNAATDDLDGDGRPSPGDANVDWKDADEFTPQTTGMRFLDVTNPASPRVAGTVLFRDVRTVDSADLVVRDLYMDDDKNVRTLRTIVDGVEYYLYNPEPGILNRAVPGDTVIDGVRWSANILPSRTYDLQFSLWAGAGFVPGRFVPRQYRLVFEDGIVDTSAVLTLFQTSGSSRTYPAVATNFRVYDVRTGERLRYGFRERKKDPAVPAGHFSGRDEIWFFENMPDGSVMPTFYLYNNTSNDTTFTNTYGRTLGSGDTLTLLTDGPFNSRDSFELAIRGEGIDAAAARRELNRIRAVPNPYVVTAAWELENPYTSGHGPRMIRFIHLPSRCTIRVYAMDGTLVRTIEHDAALSDGSEPWDLLTKDRMDVAYGMYVYHVKAPGIGETVGKLVLIK